MLRNYRLSPSHYASNWKVREITDRHDRDVINQKAYEFTTTTDAVRREQLQLEVLEAFHGYLLKYFNLIVYAQVPSVTGPQGKDAKAFLSLLIPKGTEAGHASLREAAKHLHLAFKECTTSDEVYDTLVSVFLDVCAHYDPNYTGKIKEVCDFIEKQPAGKTISLDEFAAAVDFVPLGCLRVLVRHQYIASVAGPRKKVQGYTRGQNWPPPKSFFESGPVGFVYFVTKWFRFYLQGYILGQMSQIESRERFLQLDHMSGQDGGNDAKDEQPYGCSYGLPHAEGNVADFKGQRWMVDLSMVDLWRTLDVSTLNDAWVAKTDDFLFRTLTPPERYLLQLVFVKEMSLTEIAKIMDVSAETIRNQYRDIMTFLQARAAVRPSARN